jgi:small subunit ribosomal protein S18
MASKKNKARSARDLNPRKFKKKTSVLVIEKVEYIDYKDVDLLQRFMSDRAKIRNRRVAGNTLQQQREVANAIKLAREMALLPYSKRVASTRTGGRGRDRDGGRDGGREGGREGGRGRDDSDGDNEQNAASTGEESIIDETGIDESVESQVESDVSTDAATEED